VAESPPGARFGGAGDLPTPNPKRIALDIATNSERLSPNELSWTTAKACPRGRGFPRTPGSPPVHGFASLPASGGIGSLSRPAPIGRTLSKDKEKEKEKEKEKL